MPQNTSFQLQVVDFVTYFLGAVNCPLINFVAVCSRSLKIFLQPKKSIMKKLALVAALTAVFATPFAVQAESSFVTGATASTTARLDFRVIIPRVLFLAVGTGAAGTGLAANTGIDQVTFDYTTNAGAVGSGAAAGSIVGNVVPVRVVGNNGVIALTATTTGALTNGVAAENIPWSQISVSSSDATNLPSPVIPLTGTGATSNVTVSSGTKVTNRTANWTYSYANSAVVPAGTYGTSVNGGRIIYTATMP
jgi:hypothetical protein